MKIMRLPRKTSGTVEQLLCFLVAGLLSSAVVEAQSPSVAEEDLSEPPPFSSVSEEDLAEPEPTGTPEEPRAPGLDEGAVQALFAEAEAIYLSGDEPTALLRFGQLMDLLETHLRDAEATEMAATEMVATEMAAAEAEGEMPADEASGSSAPPEDSALEVDPIAALLLRLGQGANGFVTEGW